MVVELGLVVVEEASNSFALGQISLEGPMSVDQANEN